MRPSVVLISALLGLVFAVTVMAGPTHAQTVQLTSDDYARAERFLGTSTSPLVYGNSVQSRWIDDGRF